MDFFEQPPGEGTKYIVKKYTQELVDTILKDINDFGLKVHLKEKSLSQLYNLIICVEDAIKPHCERILKNVIYKMIIDEEQEIATRTYKIAELLGLYV